MNKYLWIFTVILLLVSLFMDHKKTFQALKISFKKLIRILSLFLIVLIGFAFVITYLPSEILQKYIGAESGISGILTALGLGSISVMPGFAAFPLCAALKNQGIPDHIIAAFSISLMTVGIVTFPLEKKFLGFEVALIRNLGSLMISIIAVVIFKILFSGHL